jgi:hypothetical protein
MSDGLTVGNPLPAANGHAHMSEAPSFIPLPGEREPGEDDGFVRGLD